MKKRREKGSTDSSSSIHNSASSEHMETENSPVVSEDLDLLNCTVNQVDTEARLRRNREGSEIVDGEEDRDEALLRLPEMKDSSMDTVGQPLCDVMDRLNGALDKEVWGHKEVAGEKSNEAFNKGTEPPVQQPFREDSQSEPPDRFQGEKTVSPASPNPDFLQASPANTVVHCCTPFSPNATSSSGGHNDFAEHGQSQTLSGGLKGQEEAKAAAGQQSDVKTWEQEVGQETEKNVLANEAKEKQEDKLSPSESSHPAEFM